MISMGPVLDLDRLKTAFTSLITQSEPNVLPAFMLWVDLKVSEFKVNCKPSAGTTKQGSRHPEQNRAHWEDNATKTKSLQQQCLDLESRNMSQRMKASTSPDLATSMDSPVNLVKDLSTKHRKLEDTRHDAMPQLTSQAPEHLPKKTLKSIIDHIVKKETLSDRPGLYDVHNHMHLPVATPFMPTAMALAQTHFNMAQLLAQGPPMMLPKVADIPEVRSLKHMLPMPENEMSSPKRMCSEPTVNPEQAMCLKKAPAPVIPPVIQEGSYFPQLVAYKPESPVKVPEKQHKKDRSETPTKSHVTSALRELLTSKISSQLASREETASPEPEKLVIDEDRAPDTLDTDSEVPRSPMSEDDVGDQGRHPNKCPVCSQMFQYRSSFRRHMKVHQGIFSHVCAICARKFTRKEHFVRHKCSRKPNKASRGAHTDITGAGIITPKVEFPPIQSSPDYRSETSMDGSHSEFSDFPCSPIKVPPKTTQVAESRRKAAVPRKVVMVDDPEPVEDSFEEDQQITEFDKPQPIDQILVPSASPTKSDRSQSPDRCSPDIYYSPRKDCISHAEECEEALDLSCPQVSSSSSPQTMYEEDTPLNLTGAMPQGMPPQQEFTINTGSYKVVTNTGPEPEGKERGNQYIKVVKQGNYLRLKEEAQVIAGQLCFVCPTCGKIFHRSSNFSRHMRIHRGVYSYVCPSCQRGFFRREHFQKHKCSRRGMSHTWDRKTKIDMVLAANESQDVSDTEGVSDAAGSEESYPMTGFELADEHREEIPPEEVSAVDVGKEA